MNTIAHKRTVRVVAAAVLCWTLPLIFFASIGPIAGTTGSSRGAGGYALAESSASFTIEGDAIESISPGVRSSLNLKLSNTRDSPMTVTHVTVTVQNVTAPNANDAHPCSVRDFAVDQVPASLTITLPAHSTTPLSTLGIRRAHRPQVGMLDRPVDQDGCKGASLILAYSASGTRTSR